MLEHRQTAQEAPPISAPREKTAYPPAVHEQFQAVVRQFPDHLAVHDDGRRIDYDELNRAANRLARALVERVDPAPQPVALFLPHGADQVTAILAVLKAGHFYLPIDIGGPPGRIREIAGSSGAAVVITNDASHNQATELFADAVLLNLDALPGHLSSDNLDVAVAENALFNLLFTSGSTGRPKGVLQTHRNVLFDATLSKEMFSISAEDRFALVVPYTFGASASDIFGPLLTGGSIHSFDLKRRGLLQMAAWLHEHSITIFHSVPTVFRHWMAVLDEDEIYPAMRLVKMGGETLLRQDFELYKKHFPESCLLRNSLGSTETYLATYNLLNHSTELNGSMIPVGRATPGREILIVDDQGEAMPPGETGQIIIKSEYCSPGYWNDPELTAARFLADPDGSPARLYLTGDEGRLDPDGCLEHLGRLDDMVKIGGRSVHVSEVEGAIRDLGLVQDVAVVALTEPGKVSRLVACLIAKEQLPGLDGRIRQGLAQVLPDYMVPTSYVILDHFPLLPFGKVNRSQLAVLAAEGTMPAGRRTPSTALEKMVVAALGDILEIDDIGLDDDMFELGLHSLAIMRLTNFLQAELGVVVPPNLFFDAPVLGSFIEGIVPVDVQPEAEKVAQGRAPE